MRSFFKIFFASLLAVVVFALIGFFLMVGAISGITSKEKPRVADKSVLVLDLSTHFKEQKNEDPIILVETKKYLRWNLILEYIIFL